MFKKFLTVFFLVLSAPVFAQLESIVSSDAKVSDDYPPDTVKIRFYAENSGVNINNIKEKNDKIVSDAVNKIKSKLNNNESITTVSYNINSVYTYKDKVRVFQKYEIKNGFEVKLKDLSKISDIIKIATEAGINRVGNLNFYIEDTETICNNLLKQAVKSAKTRAEIAAEASGSSISKVKSINPYCGTNPVKPRVSYNKMAMTASLDSSSSSETSSALETGSINVSASVSMMYYLN